MRMNKISELITQYEKSGGKSSATYSGTISFYKKLCALSEFASMHSIGKSSQGRKIPYIYFGDPACNTPEKARTSGKFILFIQNCIHPGESEGNDATMLLMRELLSSGKMEELSKDMIILLVPIFNVDGHSRASKFNRVNQDGPELQGWRTTAVNLNLNRDYLKADSPEMRGMLRFINAWNPDFFIDNHTTNGLDYQYHITYSFEKYPLIHKELENYAHENILPFLGTKLESSGFLHTHYIELYEKELEEGIVRVAGLPRFSNGYFAAKNRFGLLVETHSLKPFPNRVESTLCINKAMLEYIQQYADEIRGLQKSCEQDDNANFGLEKAEFPLALEIAPEYQEEDFLGLDYIFKQSKITGDFVKRYTGEPIQTTVKVYNKVDVTNAAYLPPAYLIPAEFKEVLDVLQLHKIPFSRTKAGSKFKVAKQTISGYDLAPRPYEGRQRLVPHDIRFDEILLKTGSDFYIVTPADGLSRIIAFLLEPYSPDSFLQWGFFNAFFERKEYAEDFVFEPIAQKMLKKDSKLADNFEQMLEDEDFAEDPARRLDFFYTRSKYFDEREGVYPIFRVIEQLK